MLSVQSHVTHGYVGGKAAIFPLQTQGWAVDNINTVNFSNHTGYGIYKGTSLDKSGLKDILDGLDDIGLKYNAVITGYMPCADVIAVIGERIETWKKKCPLTYLLDPVMGDEGFLYVDKSCVSEYKNLLKRRNVDIVTPNQFELELLVDFKVNTIDDLKKAVSFLHDEYCVKYVVVTSIVFSKLDDNMLCLVSYIHGESMEIFKVPLIKSYFTGVGDLFSALLLDKLHKNSIRQNCLSRSVNQALTIMSKTLKLTHELGVKAYCQYHKLPLSEDSVAKSTINDDVMKFFELRIIQARAFYDYDEDGIFTPEYI